MEIVGRIFWGVIGAAALATGCFVGYGTLHEVREFWNPAAPGWITAVFISIGGLLCAGLLVAGVRYLQYAKTGCAPAFSFSQVFIGGIFAFFPACILSAPITLALAAHMWPGDGQAPLDAIIWSACAGLAAVPLTWIFLYARHQRRQKS